MTEKGRAGTSSGEIIREFLSKGKLLTPEALEMLVRGKYPSNTSLDMLVTAQDITSREKSYRIIKTMPRRKTELTPEDFVRFYKSKYEKIRDIITAKSGKSFVSLNKTGYHNEIHTIGMVRQIRENEGKSIVELEDTTGRASIIFDRRDAENVEPDDVIAVRAVSAQNVMFGKQVIFPDVPIRKPSTGYGKGCFVANLNLKEAAKSDAVSFFSWLESQDLRYVFVAGNIGGADAFEEYVRRHCIGKTVFVAPGEKDSDDAYPQSAMQFNAQNIVPLSNPAMVEAGGIKILLTHNFSMDFIKKRYLGKTSCVFDEDPLVLDEVPDVVCFGHSNDPQIINYKSITIVSSGSILGGFQPIVIDFATREAVKANLSF